MTTRAYTRVVILSTALSSISAMKENRNVETKWRRYAATFVAEAKHKGFSQEEVDVCLRYAKSLILSDLPAIFDISHFCLLVGYSPAYVLGAANRSEKYYRYYNIPKKSGGEREIAEPLPSLKEIQYWILENILNKVPVHPAAKAFKKRSSIIDNARFHRKQDYVLTVDIENFFPSISPNRIYSVFHNIGYSIQISSVLTDLCCLKEALPQGAPTSPVLSNLVCRSLDQRLLAFAKNNSLRYSRYADDITFSGKIIGADLIYYLYRVLSEHGFKVNQKKTRLLRRHQRQQVTGIVVNEKIQVPRELRRQLRQYAYYIEKYGFDEHASWLDDNHSHYREHLLGKAGFVRSLNKYDRDANRLMQVLTQAKLSSG